MSRAALEIRPQVPAGSLQRFGSMWTPSQQTCGCGLGAVPGGGAFSRIHFWKAGLPRSLGPPPQAGLWASLWWSLGWKSARMDLGLPPPELGRAPGPVPGVRHE